MRDQRTARAKVPRHAAEEPSGSGDWEGAPIVRVACVNVRYRNRRVDDVLAALAGLDADLLVLGETPAALRLALRAPSSGRGIGSLVVEAGFALDQVALVSRVEPVDAGRIEHDGLVAVEAVLPIADRSLRVVGVQLPPLILSTRRTWLRAHRAAASLVGRCDVPSVFAGDFNALAWQDAMRALARLGWRDAAHDVGRRPLATWPAWLPALGLDHVLVSGGVHVRALRRIELPGSDHRGLVAEVAVGASVSTGEIAPRTRSEGRRGDGRTSLVER